MRDETPVQPPKSRTRPTVSLCMIVRDEERNIGRCLESIKPIVNEMIVVDTGSKDGTKSIAMSYGAKVYDFKWNDDFAAARNFGLQKAGCDWILVMDADETISKIDHSAFRDFCHAIDEKDHQAFLMTTRNYTEKHNAENWTQNDGKYPESQGHGWIPTEKVRLFPNNKGIHFIFPVHELVDPVLTEKGFRMERCPIPVHHFGKLDHQRNRQRWQSYYRIGKNKLNALGENPLALRELAIQAALLNHLEESAEYWSRYIRFCPESENAWTNLASLYSRLGCYKRARTAAYEALKLAPGKLEPLYNVVISELQDGNAVGAAKASDRLLCEFPDYAQGHVLQAVSHVCAGELKTGIERFKSTRDKMDNQQFMQMIVEISAPLRHAGRNEWIRSICDAVRHVH
jgi:O-antigen biosynthesis protein